MSNLKLYTVNAVSLAVIEVTVVAENKHDAEEKATKIIDDVSTIQIKAHKYSISTTDKFDQIVVEDGVMQPHDNDLKKWGYPEHTA